MSKRRALDHISFLQDGNRVTVDILGDAGKFVDVFHCWASAEQWARDVLVCYFDRRYTEADIIVHDAPVLHADLV